MFRGFLKADSFSAILAVKMEGVITAHLYNRDRRTLQALDVQGILDSTPVPRTEVETPADTAQGAFRGTHSACRAGELLWIDVTAPSDEDYDLISRRFGLHDMVGEDLRAHEGRPKLHDYGAYIYIIFHALSYELSDGDKSQNQSDPPSERFSNKFSLKATEVDCLIGSDYVITFHEETLAPIEDLKKRWNRSPEMMSLGASYLLYEIMDEVLDDYFPLLDTVDERVDELESRLFLTQDSSVAERDGMSGDIFALKRTLVQIRRIAGPTRDVVNVLLRRDAESGGKQFAYYQDLYDHSVRIVDITDTFRDILSGLLDAYLALASNRMNEVMKTLTAASIMLLVPGLIAGIYGMNFENMPELKTHNGYFFVLGVMATAVATLFAMFKRKGWL
ncbi:MAG TPA: magnesium/cobalt transporter CorA [Abditibacterium sp.]|jgi:magnesium transporter